MTRRGVAAALAAAAIAAAAPARASWVEEYRRSSARALAVDVERLVLPNGLVVLLSPDPTVSSAGVWMTFRAGAIDEPPGRSGLAHVVEHALATGLTPETDYAALLERRRARVFNASTGFDRMVFETIVPAEELPLALWVAAERLATLPALVDEEAVQRHLRVVRQERALRDVDVPYGLAREALFRSLYPAPHPLHGGVIGTPAELDAITAADVRAFAAARLVPSNGVLTITGRFDPAVAKRLVAETVGRLPPGRRPRDPALPRVARESRFELRAEPLSRLPRVMMGWRVQGIPPEDALALELGAQLLTALTDGAWGMRLGAGLVEYPGESTFFLDLTVPYDEPPEAIDSDAEAFLRFLTLKEMPFEHLVEANLALDRFAMLELDALEGRAAALTRLELGVGPRRTVAERHDARWALDAGAVRDVARAYLRGPRMVLHARPTRPKPARAERE